MQLIIKRLLILLFLSSSVYLNSSWVHAEPSDASSRGISTEAHAVTIEIFVREGCPHCTQAKAFLQTLKQENPALNLVIRDVLQDPAALTRLQTLAQQHAAGTVRVPAIYVKDQLIVGYSDDTTSGQLIRQAVTDTPFAKSSAAESCTVAEEALECSAEDTVKSLPTSAFSIDFWGHTLTLEDIGLPLFTLAMGLLDGFNPCSLWVLILMISLLAPMQDRLRMCVIAGTFVAVEGITYFIFMAAWLNLFLLIGLSRISEIIIAVIALVAGLINLKDFWFFGWGVSLSIPDAAKPSIYARLRRILSAQNMTGAILGAVVLALLVQIVEFMCTSGFPALYTRILTLSQLNTLQYYGYLLLYNAAYMLDDIVILGIGIVTLSQRRLQEKEGRWLKLISGIVMVGLGIYLLIRL